ncbi:MAG: FHA domain-containing protein [Planctomycetaceae bacterium]
MVLSPVTSSLPKLLLKPGRWTVGSAATCSYRIVAEGVQPRHALLLCGSQHTVLKAWDANTRLNGQLVRGEVRLHPGDRVGVGSVQFIVEPADPFDVLDQLPDAPREVMARPQATITTPLESDGFDLERLRGQIQELRDELSQRVTRRMATNSPPPSVATPSAPPPSTASQPDVARTSARIAELEQAAADARRLAEATQQQLAALRAEQTRREAEWHHDREQLFADFQQQQIAWATEHTRLLEESLRQEDITQQALLTSAQHEQELVEQSQQLLAERQQLNAERQRLDADHERIDVDHQQIETLRQQLAHDQRQLVAAQQQAEAVRQQVAANRQQVEAKHLQLEAEQLQLETNRQQAAAIWQQLEAEQQRVAAERQQIEAKHLQLESARQQDAATRQQLEADQQQVAAERQQIEAKHLQLESARQQDAATRQQIEADQQQVAAERQQIEADQRQLESARQQIAATQQQLETDQQRVAAERQQIEADQRQLETSRQQDAATRQQIEADQQRVAAERQQLEADQLQLESARQQIAATQQQLETDQQRVAAERQQFEADQLQLEADRQQVAATQQQFEADLKRVTAERQQIETDQLQLETAWQQVAATQQQLEADQQQVAAEREQIEADQRQLEADRQQLLPARLDSEQALVELSVERERVENHAAELLCKFEEFTQRLAEFEQQQAQLARDQQVLEHSWNWVQSDRRKLAEEKEQWQQLAGEREQFDAERSAWTQQPSYLDTGLPAPASPLAAGEAEQESQPPEFVEQQATRTSLPSDWETESVAKVEIERPVEDTPRQASLEALPTWNNDPAAWESDASPRLPLPLAPPLALAESSLLPLTEDWSIGVDLTAPRETLVAERPLESESRWESNFDTPAIPILTPTPTPIPIPDSDWPTRPAFEVVNDALAEVASPEQPWASDASSPAADWDPPAPAETLGDLSNATVPQASESSGHFEKPADRARRDLETLDPDLAALRLELAEKFHLPSPSETSADRRTSESSEPTLTTAESESIAPPSPSPEPDAPPSPGATVSILGSLAFSEDEPIDDSVSRYMEQLLARSQQSSDARGDRHIPVHSAPSSGTVPKPTPQPTRVAPPMTVPEIEVPADSDSSVLESPTSAKLRTLRTAPVHAQDKDAIREVTQQMRQVANQQTLKNVQASNWARLKRSIKIKSSLATFAFVLSAVLLYLGYTRQPDFLVLGVCASLLGVITWVDLILAIHQARRLTSQLAGHKTNGKSE